MKYLFPVLLFLLSQQQLYAQNAPDFTVTLSDGSTKNLYADYLNNGKTVVLKFFFTACTFCQQITPMVETLYQDWGAGQYDVEIISLGIYSLDNNAAVNAYKLEYGSTWPGVGNDGGSNEATEPYLNEVYGEFLGTPTFAVIAPDGAITWDPRGNNLEETVTVLDMAIENTGASRPGAVTQVSGTILSASGEPVLNVDIQASAGNYIAGLSGSFQITELPVGSDLTITPVKNGNPSNGVTTFDMVIISQHILSIAPMDNPHQQLAADVNNSGSITTLDLVQIKKVILGIDAAFNNADSWKFDPPNIAITNLGNGLNANFVAIKTGDVNFSADPGL